MTDDTELSRESLIAVRDQVNPLVRHVDDPARSSMHRSGLRAACIEANNSVVVECRDQEGNAVCSEVILKMDDSGRVQRHRAQLLADAICHAINAGMNLNDVNLLTSKLTSFAELCPGYPTYPFGVVPLGLHIDRYPAIRYVANDLDTNQLYVIWPGIRTEELSAKEFVNGLGR